MNTSLTEKLNELLRQVSLIELIRGDGYKTLNRGGEKYLSQCPFHKNGQEQNPSLSVDNEKGLYKCFTCGAKGNIISYLRDKNGMSFKDSVIFLGRRFSVNVDDFFSSKGSKKIYVINESKRVNKLAMHFFGKKLLSKNENGYIYKEAVEYLKKRKIPFEIVKEFKIGFAPPLWDNLTLTLTKNKNVHVKYLASLGLSKTKNGTKYFDGFINRIMFPILSEDGSVIGFGARSIDGKEPKYINSSESIIFKKKYSLYGINIAKTFIMQKDMAILVEGYMDVIAMHKMGIKNVLGTLGTACTEYHIKLIKKYTSNIVLFFDNDEAGRKAAELAIRICLKENVKPFVFSLTEEKDIDEYFETHNTDEFNQIFEGRVIWYDCLLEDVKKHSFSIEERMKHITKMFSFLDLLTHETEKDAIITHLSNELGINKISFINDYKKNKNIKSVYDNSYKNTNDDNAKRSKEYTEEKEIIYLLTVNPEYIEFVENRLTMDKFNGQIAKELYGRLLTLDKDKRTMENALLVIDNEHIAERIRKKAKTALYSEAVEAKLIYGIKKMEERRKEKEKIETIRHSGIENMLKSTDDIDALVNVLKKIQDSKKTDIQNDN